MRSSRLLVGLLSVLSVTGCLASKGDIRLLQDELRAMRAGVARTDSAHRREADSLATVLAALASAQARGDQALQQAQQQTDAKLGELLSGVRTFELTTTEKFRGLSDDVAQVQEL